MADITPLFAAAQQPPAAVPDAAAAAGMQLVGSILHDIAALQSVAGQHNQVLQEMSASLVLLGQGIQAACSAADEIAQLRARVEALEALLGALTAPAQGSA